MLTTIVSLILMNFMIDAAAKTPNAQWHPYVVVANSLESSTHLNQVAAIVNLSILLCLVCTWLGFCIAAIVQAWELVRTFRKRAAQARDPAVLGSL